MPFKQGNSFGFRFQRGAFNPNAKLDPEVVRAIRSFRRVIRMPVASIAFMAGVSNVTVYNILNGKIWNWVED